MHGNGMDGGGEKRRTSVETTFDTPSSLKLLAARTLRREMGSVSNVEGCKHLQSEPPRLSRFPCDHPRLSTFDASVNRWRNVFEGCSLRRFEVSQRSSTLFRRFSAVAAGAAGRRRWARRPFRGEGGRLDAPQRRGCRLRLRRPGWSFRGPDADLVQASQQVGRRLGGDGVGDLAEDALATRSPLMPMPRWMAEEKNKRALPCMLWDARKKLKPHGRRNFAGKGGQEGDRRRRGRAEAPRPGSASGGPRDGRLGSEGRRKGIESDMPGFAFAGGRLSAAGVRRPGGRADNYHRLANNFGSAPAVSGR
jgi:hypothetical protein